MNSQVGPLSSLVPLAQYGAARQHVFSSATSMTWFVRQHKAALVEHGAILMIAGRWFAKPEAFDAFVIELGKQSALAAIAKTGGPS